MKTANTFVTALRTAGVLLLVGALTACGGDRGDGDASSKKAGAVDSGLIVEDVKKGSGEMAANKSAVAMHYTGWLYDDAAEDHKGAEFDSSFKRNKPLEFVLGMGRVIKGWDQGIEGMQVGGKRRLVIPPELGYGERGFGQVIPPNSTLMFDVELVAVASVDMTDHLFGEGAQAGFGQEVTVDYTGWLFDENAVGNKGEKFDSSLDRDQKFSFVLGQGRVISGWEVGVEGMKVGGKRTLVIPPSMAYGARGRQGIPPNSTLVFDIELFDVKGGPAQ